MKHDGASSSVQSGQDESSSRVHRRRVAAAVVLLVAVTAAVFGRVYDHGFLAYDDSQHVTDNPLLNPVTWRGVGEFWQGPYFGLYIPLSYTFFAAEASIARLPLPDGIRSNPNPLVFHLGNLGLHVACVLLVFVILRRLLRHDGAACAGAVLFALHPMQVESVAWISETRGVLCGLFSLLAVWQYLVFADASGTRKSAACHYAAATVAFTSAMLCKPAAVAVPFMAGVLPVGMLRRPIRRTLWSLIPWLVLSAAWAVLTKLQQPDANLPFTTNVWARILLAGDALTFYLVKLMMPLRCAPDYGYTPPWVMQQWWSYVAWMLPVAVLVVLARTKDRRVWLTAAAVFVAWLLPVLGLVPFDFQRISTVADRYLYLAMLGPALAIGWFLARHWTRKMLAAAGVVLGLLGVLSFLQTGHWRDDESLIAHTLQVNPRSVLARQHRGFLLARDGRHEEAVALYRAVLADHPMHPELYLSLAASLDALKRSDEAMGELHAALEEHPRWPLVRCKLAETLWQQGAIDEAVEQYRTALRHDPDCSLGHLQLGKLLLDRVATEGEIDEGIQHLRQALDDVHTRVPAHVELGRALEVMGKPSRARYHYRAALETRPHDVVALYNLARLLADDGEVDQAAELYRRVLALDPGYARAHINLGMLLFQHGHRQEAMAHCHEALRLLPDTSKEAIEVRRFLEQLDNPRSGAHTGSGRE